MEEEEEVGEGSSIESSCDVFEVMFLIVIVFIFVLFIFLGEGV